jgi:hypothetical protein
MTIDTPPKPEHGTREEVVEYSRAMYTHPRAEVEAAISKWREPIVLKYEERPQRREERGRFPSQSVSRPTPKPEVSLSDLVKKAAPTAPKATGASVVYGEQRRTISNTDLKELISKALGKK